MTSSKTVSHPTVPFPAAEYERRIERLQKRLAAKRIDAMVIENPINRLYLTGFESSAGMLLLRPGERPTLYMDFRYLEMARRQASFLKVGAFKKNGTRYRQVVDLARKGRWRKGAYESSVGKLTFDRLREALPGVKEWIDGEPFIHALRAVKSRREQAVMREAVCAADMAFASSLEHIRPGMTEWEIRTLLRERLDHYSQGESFPSIVAVGSNASKCHHHPSLRPLRHNQELLIDMGALVDGYASDMTRTVFFGRPSPRLAEIYRIVLEANLAAIAAVRAGKTGGEVDAVARGIISKAGYGKRFEHGTGHGIGLVLHESGGFSKGSTFRLKAGMVMTVEPGIYLPGVGGVRIEDMVIVRKDGCDVLTRTPKSLQCL